MLLLICFGILARVETGSATPAAEAAAEAEIQAGQEVTAKGPGWETGPVIGRRVPAKVVRHARRVVARYDRDQDGLLAAAEWEEIPAAVVQADRDGNQRITAEEISHLIFRYGQRRSLGGGMLGRQPDPAGTPPAERESDGPPAAAAGGISNAPLPAAANGRAERAGRYFVPPAQLPAGVPAWFLERDVDGDGQLSFAEFAPQQTQGELRQFGQYDSNDDGIMTAAESAQARGGASRDERALEAEGSP